MAFLMRCSRAYLHTSHTQTCAMEMAVTRVCSEHAVTRCLEPCMTRLARPKLVTPVIVMWLASSCEMSSSDGTCLGWPWVRCPWRFGLVSRLHACSQKIPMRTRICVCFTKPELEAVCITGLYQPCKWHHSDTPLKCYCVSHYLPLTVPATVPT